MPARRNDFVSAITHEQYQDVAAAGTRKEKYGVTLAKGALARKDTLKPVAPDKLAAEMLAASGVDWSFGPLRVQAQLAGGRIQVSVFLLGVRIGSASLNTSKPGFKIGANVGAAKVELELRADFSARRLTASGRVCVRVPRVGIPPWKWSCRSFSITILRW